jgi:hypothetical protein
MEGTFKLGQVPISGKADASSGGGGTPVSSGVGNAKEPSGGKQSSGEASRARSGLNLAGKGENLNDFPTCH